MYVDAVLPDIDLSTYRSGVVHIPVIGEFSSNDCLQ